MQIHKNARLTPVLREELARKVLYGGTTLSGVARAYNVSVRTAAKWIRRFQHDGSAGLLAIAHAARSPRQLSPDCSDEDCKALLFSIHPQATEGLRNKPHILEDH